MSGLKMQFSALNVLKVLVKDETLIPLAVLAIQNILPLKLYIKY